MAAPSLARTLFLAALFVSAAVPACSQTPVVVPVRSMERPKDVDFVCLKVGAAGTRGAPLEKCQINPDGTAVEADEYHLHAIVTQLSRGELAIVDLGQLPGNVVTNAAIVKEDPRLPGFTFLPVSAVPNDVAADPNGRAVYVASGRDPKIDIIPAEILRGPIDSTASSGATAPWPHIDLDRKTEGVASHVAAVRDATGTFDRLYAVLSEATGGPKIAVFDISKTPLAPARIGTIALTVSTAAPLAIGAVQCGPLPGKPDPWWVSYENSCALDSAGNSLCATPCATGSACRRVGNGDTASCVASTPQPPVVAPTSPRYHLGGIAVAGDYLYAADDAAPVIHVFDIGSGRGVEVARLGVGSPTARLAVSEPLPDETTLYNAPALEVCDEQNWFGDGKDHTADSGVVGDRLGGFCRAHRYIYAIDPANAREGDGTIAAIDVPTRVTSRKKSASNAVTEVLDAPSFGESKLVTPFACDSPALSTKRISLGTLGLGGSYAVPARAVAFFRNDFASPTNGLTGVRCRPWDDYRNVDPVRTSGASGKTFDDTSIGLSRARLDAAASWQISSAASAPTRLRGTFAMAVLDSGALVFIDVDDLDAMCRGPRDDSTKAAGLDYFSRGSTTILGPGATGEYTTNVSRRHHPRSSRSFDADTVPTTTSVVVTTGTSSVSSDPTTPAGVAAPHFVPIGASTASAMQVTTSPDSPYALGSEDWSVTYEGVLPGFGGTAGTFIAGDDGTFSLRDPGGAFCHRGVEAPALPSDPSMSAAAIEAHDLVQIVDDVCVEGPLCSAKQAADCLATFGAATDPTPRHDRDIVIKQAFEDHLVLAHGFHDDGRTITPLASVPPSIKTCFPGLTRYVVRAKSSWVVAGSSTGYLHRWTIAPPRAGQPPLMCELDPTRPSIYRGRATELPPLPPTASSEALFVDRNDCRLFRNPSWIFGIRAGRAADDPTKPDGSFHSSSVRDMRFSFSTRFTFYPLAVGVGSLPMSLRPLSYFSRGVDRLGWNMVATVDAIDRGLTVFSVNNLAADQIKIVN